MFKNNLINVSIIVKIISNLIIWIDVFQLIIILILLKNKIENDNNDNKDKSSKIKLTKDTYITSLENADKTNSNIDFNGYKLYVNGKAIN